VTDRDKSRDFRSSALQRPYSWLMVLWMSYVLITFFVIRILGSSVVHRLLSLLKPHLLR